MENVVSPKGLGEIQGLCACYTKTTLNGRGYNEIYKRILNHQDYRFEEMMRRGGILCEFGHPSQYTADFERTETDPEKACVLITDIEEKEHGNIYAKGIILDTPAGRTYKAIAPFYKFGFSSRGSYEVDEDNPEGPDGWNQDTYVFKGFDIVALPANEGSEISATEGLATKKSKKIKSARESLDLQNIADAAELDPAEVDAELDKLFNKDGSLDKVELVDARKFANDELSNTTSNTKKDNPDNILLDLHKVLVDKNELEKQVQKLLFEKAESDASILALNKQLEEMKALQDDAEAQLAFYIKNKEEIQTLLDKLVQTHDSQISDANDQILAKDNQIKSLASQVADLNNRSKQSEELESDLAATTEQLKSEKDRADKAEADKQAANQELGDTQDKLTAAKEELKALKQELSQEKKKSNAYAKIAISARESLISIYSEVYSVDSKALKAKVGNTSNMSSVRTAAESLSRDALKFASYQSITPAKSIKPKSTTPFTVVDEVDKELYEALKQEGHIDE